MHWKQISLSILALICLGFTIGELKHKYPQDYFRSPIDDVIRLSGTFGELRPNHFHSGIDIKSKSGGVGQSIYAVADGYVERIKVRPGGYGNALYIKHPNGYSSVYAHLNVFDQAIEDYVKTAQYVKKSFSVDLYPNKDRFVFKKGDIIAEMGNSGGSSGPHLHFEIRKGSTPINPLLFGIPFQDDLAPRMHQLKIYNLNSELETQRESTFNLSKKGKNYSPKKDTLEFAAWRIGLGLKVYDHMNGVSNWNGIYSLDVFLNDSLVYAFDFEKFRFDETRYINAHVDYGEKISKNSNVNRCYQLPGNRLSIYNEQINDGVIPLFQNKAGRIKMVAKDANGNNTSVVFWVKRSGDEVFTNNNSFNYELKHDQKNTIDLSTCTLEFPKGAFYENCYFNYKTIYDYSDGYYSATYKLHTPKTPVHKYFKISIQPENLPDSLKDKAIIAYCDHKNNTLSCGGKWIGNRLQSEVRALGDYSIMVDDEAPTVKPVRFKYNLEKASKMSFQVKDNFDTSGKAAGIRYKATVDDEWILMEYDAKNDLLIHRFDDRIEKGKHQLKIKVWDNRNNTTIFRRTFVR